MSKMWRELHTKQQRTPPDGSFRPCVKLESGAFIQIGEDQLTFEKAATICAVYSYGRDAFVYNSDGIGFSV